MEISLLLFVALVGYVYGGRQASLFQNRVISELKEIIDQGLSLSTPFNSSKEECGVRLSPLRNNLLEWHFSFTGIEGSSFDGGVYHGKIILDPKYPQKAPEICMLTPSGRWKIGEFICLSASAYHPELWDPSWNLRTLVLSLRGFMATQANEIGSLRSSAITQRELAAKSREYKCPACNSNHINLVVGGCGLSQEGVASLGAKLLLNMNRRGKAANKSKGPLRADGKQLSNSNLRHNSLQNQKCGQFWRKKDAQRDIVIRRWGISRKALLYSASFLLFGLWKLCVRLIDQHFLTASVSS